jgi:DNA-binding transcriptional ArsR family regulator
MPATEKQKTKTPPPTLTNQQLIAAMEHPTRVHAVTVLNERTACASEIGRELDRPAKHVSYHLGKLEDLGVIEYVGEREVPGSKRKARYYRALVRPWFDTESWKQVDPENQPKVTANILALCNADISAAVVSGTIHGQDNHISRIPMILTRGGYERLVKRLDGVTEELVAFQQEDVEGMKPGEEMVLTKVHIIQFESPNPEDYPTPAQLAGARGQRPARS